MKKIIAFSGSNSSTSINQQLIRMTAKMAKGAEVTVLDIRDFPAVMYGPDEENTNGFPETMVEFQKHLLSADGFIVSSPEHNGNVPAVLKNTLDWVSRMGGKVFNNKPTVFLTTSPGGRGGATVMSQLLAVMPHQGAQIVGSHSLGNFHDKVKDNDITDGEDKARIETLVNELVLAI